MYRHLRPLVNELTVKEYYLELATIQFNEVLRSIQHGTEGTLILPLNDNSPNFDFEEYNTKFGKLNLYSSDLLTLLQSRVQKYYQLVDKDIVVPTSVNIKKISEWNKKLLIQAVSYLLLEDALYSIERR